MKYLDRTFSTPEENLACDETLLEACEADPACETLRFWEPHTHFIVLGLSNRINQSVRLQACQDRTVPILRRITGGGAILQGPGCLNFSLALRIDRSPNFRTIIGTNCQIIRAHLRALQPLLGPNLTHEGDTDLARSGLKFSGNAQRRKRNALLFHGTFLLQLDLNLLEALMPLPERQPAYRNNRTHQSFLTNLGIRAEAIKQTLRSAWEAREQVDAPPIETSLVRRYQSDTWNLKL
jgi:lipoate---protein ligase